jgi:RimJ/RimL family protein N-acetyltransferase
MITNFALEHLLLRDGGIVIRSAHADDESLLASWFRDNPRIYAYWGGVPLSLEKIAAHCRVDVDESETCWPFIIIANAQPVGFIQAWVRNDMSGGLDLVLAPQHRRRGIGRRALLMLSAYLRDTAGWARITVDPRIDNIAAVEFFAHCRFFDTGERFSEEDHTHMLMEFR